MKSVFKISQCLLVFLLFGRSVYSQDGGQLIMLQSDASIARYDIANETYETVGCLSYPGRPTDKFIHDGKWWCFSSNGGRHNQGVLFSLDLDGSNYQLHFEFDYTFTAGFVQDDKIWGYTRYGGENDQGTLGYYDLVSQAYHTVHHFELSHGAYPSSLIWIEDKIWGTASEGFGLEVEESDGVIFSYNIEESEYSVVYRLADEGLGSSPRSLVYNGSDIYGLYLSSVSQTGLFSCALDGSEFSHRWNFNGSVISGQPNHIFNENGRITGVTNEAWFQYVATASSPYLTGSNYFKDQGAGKPASIMKYGIRYYGVTRDEGEHGLGTIYSLYGGEVTTLHSFAGAGNGVEPRLPLSIYDNQFYGFSYRDEDEPAVMYQLDPTDNTFNILHTFDAKLGENFGNFLQTEESYFAISTKGGEHGNGTLIAIDPSTFEAVKLHDFEESVLTNIVFHNNKVYGSKGYDNTDPSNYGFVYRIDDDGSNFEIIHEFESMDGRWPRHQLSVIDGRIWGINDGVFSMESDGTDFQTEQNFWDEFSYPEFGLFEYDNKVWGICRYGGDDDQGGIYSIDLENGTYVEHLFFDSDQAYVNQKPILYRSSLYLTQEGNQFYGRANQISKFDLSSLELSTIYSFEGESYYDIHSGLTPFRGRLWGTTDRGADQYAGVLFSLSLEGTDFQVHQPYTDELEAAAGFRPIMIGIDLQYANIQFMDLSNLTYGLDPFELQASSNSDASITYTSSNDAIISVNDGVATVHSAGECWITAAQEENEAYTSAEAVVSVKVEKAMLTARANDQTKVYGDENPELTISYTGFVYDDGLDDLGDQPQINTSATSASGAGIHDIIISGGNASNYELILENGFLTIDQAQLTITANDQSKFYGDENPPFTMSFAGFVNGDNSNDLIELPKVSSTASATTDVGTYEITLTGGNAANYALTLTNGTLEIEKATLTCTSSHLTKIYGESNPDLVYTLVGFVNEDQASDLDALPQLSTIADELSSVGSYEILLDTFEDQNYLLDFKSGMLNVAPAPLKVIAQDLSIQQFDQIPQLTLKYEGFVNGDSEEDIVPPSISTNAPTSDKPGVFDITLSGGEAKNYEFDLVNGTLTIEFVLDSSSPSAARPILYPNPTNHSITLSGIQNLKSVSIFDHSGQLIKQIKDSKIQMTDLETGIYHVVVVTEQNRFVYRVIKN